MKSPFLILKNLIKFYFVIILYLLKNCKYTTKSSHISFTLASPKVNILHNTIIKTKTFTFVQYYQATDLIQMWPEFSLLFQDSIHDTMLHLVCLPSFLRSVSFCQFFCFS